MKPRPLHRRVTMIGPTPDVWQWFGIRCPTCEALRLVRKVDHGDGSGHWECWICGYVSGVWLSGGLLDLGLVADSDLNPDNSFEIFPAPPGASA